MNFRRAHKVLLPAFFFFSVFFGTRLAQLEAQAQNGAHPVYNPPAAMSLQNAAIPSPGNPVPDPAANAPVPSVNPSDPNTQSSMSPEEALKLLQQAAANGNLPAGVSVPTSAPGSLAPSPQASPGALILPPPAGSALPPPAPGGSMNGLPPPAGQVQPEKFVPSEIITAAPATTKHIEPRVIVRTTMGDFTIRLFDLEAKRTVKHFLGLVKGDKEFVDVKTGKRVKRPFYDGLIVHKVVKGYYIQTGCPFGTGRGGPGDIATIKDEINKDLHFDKPGVVAMAPARDEKTGLITIPDTNGSQFFVTLAPMPEWDGKFTIFGEVESGMDVVAKISAAKAGPTDRPIKKIFVNSITVADDETDANGVPVPNDKDAPVIPTDGSIPPEVTVSPSPGPAASPANPAQVERSATTAPAPPANTH